MSNNIYNVLKSVPTEKYISHQRYGFKGTDKDMCCCNDFQYELGKWYKHKGKLIPCESGFHLCRNFIDVFNYYNGRHYTNDCKDRYFIVEYGEKYIKHEDKIITDEIRLIKEIIFSDIKEVPGDKITNGISWGKMIYPDVKEILNDKVLQRVGIDPTLFMTYCLIVMIKTGGVDYEKFKYLIRKGAKVEIPRFSLIFFLDDYSYYNLLIYTIRYNPDVDLSKAKNYGKQIAKLLEKHNHYDLYDVELFNLPIYKDGKLYPSVS